MEKTCKLYYHDVHCRYNTPSDGGSVVSWFALDSNIPNIKVPFILTKKTYCTNTHWFTVDYSFEHIRKKKLTNKNHDFFHSEIDLIK